MEKTSLQSLNPLSLLACGFEYRTEDPNSDEGYEEYYFKVLGQSVDESIGGYSIDIDDGSWIEVVLSYEAYVSDSPFCETLDNFNSELQDIFLRAVTKRKRETFIKKSEIKHIKKSEFMMAGASVFTTLDSIHTDDELFTFIRQLGGKLDLSKYKPERKGKPFKNAPPNYF